MEKKVLKSGPGVLVGISTYRSHPGKVRFYDGDDLRLTVTLKLRYKPRTENRLELPGLELDMFFKRSIVMECPEGAEVQAVVD